MTIHAKLGPLRPEGRCGITYPPLPISIVAISDPVYPVYVDTNVMAGHTGEPDESGAYAGITYLPCTAQNGFIPEPPQGKVDVIYLCSPNNPTGAAATRPQLSLRAGAASGGCVIGAPLWFAPADARARRPSTSAPASGAGGAAGAAAGCAGPGGRAQGRSW